jgi:hypothetical protein
VFATIRAACYRIAMREPISFRPSAAALPSRLKLWAGRISLAAVAPLVLFAARFGRTFILSRLLGPGDFGIAAIASQKLLDGGEKQSHSVTR